MKIIFLPNDKVIINQIAYMLQDGFGGDPGFYRERLKCDLENKLIPFTMIALDEDQIVGTAGTYINWGDENFGPWFGRLYALPHYRKKGIAKILFEAISNQCKELGYSIIYLHTPSQENLYKKWGWQMIKKIERNNKVESLMKFALN